MPGVARDRDAQNASHRVHPSTTPSSIERGTPQIGEHHPHRDGKREDSVGDYKSEARVVQSDSDRSSNGSTIAIGGRNRATGPRTTDACRLLLEEKTIGHHRSDKRRQCGRRDGTMRLLAMP